MGWGVVVASVSWAAHYFPAYFIFWAYGNISGHNILGDWIGYLVWPLTYPSTALLEAIEKRWMVCHGLLVKTLPQGNPGEGDTRCDQSPSMALNMSQTRRWKGYCLPSQEKQCGNW
jgi:hypothetical protein